MTTLQIITQHLANTTNTKIIHYQNKNAASIYTNTNPQHYTQQTWIADIRLENNTITTHHPHNPHPSTTINLANPNSIQTLQNWINNLTQPKPTPYP